MKHQITVDNIPKEMEDVFASSSGIGGYKSIGFYFNVETKDIGYSVREKFHGARYFFKLNEAQKAIDKYNSL